MAKESAAFKKRARKPGGINKGEKGAHRLSATNRHGTPETQVPRAEPGGYQQGRRGGECLERRIQGGVETATALAAVDATMATASAAADVAMATASAAWTLSCPRP